VNWAKVGFVGALLGTGALIYAIHQEQEQQKMQRQQGVRRYLQQQQLDNQQKTDRATPT
jgi:hypothetical protein